MEVNLIFRHIDATDGLREHANEKIEKLKKYMHKPVKMTVIFSLEKYIHHVDVTFSEKNHVFEAHGKTNDMYASIDQAMHALQEQLRRDKDKIKNHKDYEHSNEAKLRGAQSLHDEKHLSAVDSYYKQKKKTG